MSNGWIELKLEILKWIEIEIGLGSDPTKIILGSNGLGSNGLKIGLFHDLPNPTSLISVLFTYCYLIFIATI